MSCVEARERPSSSRASGGGAFLGQTADIVSGGGAYVGQIADVASGRGAYQLSDAGAHVGQLCKALSGHYRNWTWARELFKSVLYQDHTRDHCSTLLLNKAACRL